MNPRHPGANPLAIAIGLAATGLVHSPAPYADDMFLEEIIVTAQKREENLQSTPIAISAVGADILEERGIQHVSSLSDYVPGLYFAQGTSDTHITLRGLGTGNNTATGDPGVSFFIDGVYQGRARAAHTLFYDLERIEVLRGPQGTLWGRNTTGGSINLIAKKPQQEFSADIDLLAGNYNDVRVRGILNLPLSDDLALRVSALDEKRDGYYRNLTPGADDISDEDVSAVRAQLAWNLSDNLDLLFQARYSARGGVGYGAPTRIDPRPANSLLGVADLISTLQDLTPPLPVPEDPYEVRTSDGLERDNFAKGLNMTLTWELPHFTFKSITGWDQNVVDMLSDIDGSELDIVLEDRNQDSRQYSQEFQFTSGGAGKLQWVAGLYLFRETTDVDYYFIDGGAGLLDRVPFPIPVPPFAVFPYGPSPYFGNETHVEVDSNAVYGQFTYAVADAVNITLGARYTTDEKRMDDTRRKDFGQPFLPLTDKREDWSKPTWKLGVDWQMSDDTLWYASVATGYKAGGFLIKEGDEPYDPENLTAFEIGLKSRYWNGRAQTNVSAYYYDYSDMQVRVIRDLTDIVENAADATINGLEVEFIVLPTDQLQLRGNIAWTNAEFDEYETSDPLIVNGPVLDLAGNKLRRTPELTFNINGEYTWPIGDGELAASLSYYWSDEIHMDFLNSEAATQDQYHRTDARLSYRSSGDKWFVAAFAKNLEDDAVADNYRVRNPSYGDRDWIFYRAPRTYGLELGYHFD